jgi:hypothetical protein
VSVRARGFAMMIAIAAIGLPSCSSTNYVPDCDEPIGSSLVLTAQAVPSATLLPCVQALPPGWNFSSSVVQQGSVSFWLDSTIAGIQAVHVELTETCDTTGAVEILPAPDEAGARVFQNPVSLDPFRGSREIVFAGGCVTYRYNFTGGAQAGLSLEVVEALSFVPRDVVVRHVEETYDDILCGAGAPPCEG